VDSYPYSSGRLRRDPRYCRTHAMVAELFARTSSRDFDAKTWEYVAQAWSELAALKERENSIIPARWPERSDFGETSQP
jgi:hypothetical protein